MKNSVTLISLLRSMYECMGVDMLYGILTQGEIKDNAGLLLKDMKGLPCGTYFICCLKSQRRLVHWTQKKCVKSSLPHIFCAMHVDQTKETWKLTPGPILWANTILNCFSFFVRWQQPPIIIEELLCYIGMHVNCERSNRKILVM